MRDPRRGESRRPGTAILDDPELRQGASGSNADRTGYVRRIHDVVEDAISLPAGTGIPVTERIHVGFPREAWREIRPCLDLLLDLDTPPDTCVGRIAARNRAAGRSVETIRHKLRNDLRFMQASLEVLCEADAVVVGG